MREENNTLRDIERTPLARDQELKDRWAIGVTWYISGSRRRQFLEGVEHKQVDARSDHTSRGHAARDRAAILPPAAPLHKGLFRAALNVLQANAVPPLRPFSCDDIFRDGKGHDLI